MIPLQQNGAEAPRPPGGSPWQCILPTSASTVTCAPRRYAPSRVPGRRGLHLAGIKASEDPRVQPYREAFHALGMSPSRYPSSNIALLRRVAKGKGVGRINPLVDIGNAVSIAHGLPLGVHVMSSPDSVLELRMSREGDVFVPLGADEADPTLAPGELVYAEGGLVQTRRWTWRQSENGKTGPDASSALVPIDGFTDKNLDAVLAARDHLAALITEAFGCGVATGLASTENPHVELSC